MEHTMQIRGISPVLAIPFDKCGVIDLGSFSRLARHVIATGITSLMFPGFASEFYKLAAAERGALLEVLLSETTARPSVAAIVSVSEHATTLAVASAQRAIEQGADAINLLPPHFLNPAPSSIRDHVRAVLESVDPTPVVLQYAPAFTGSALSPSVVAELAADHPNLQYIKVESRPAAAVISALAARGTAPHVLVGYAGIQMLDALSRGAVGVQPGCSFTEIYLDIWRLLQAGDKPGATRLHRQLLPYITYWMQSVELIVAAEKLIAARRGLIESAHCRLPAYRLDELEMQTVDRFLEEFADRLPSATAR